jgi:hypothetical protein
MVHASSVLIYICILFTIESFRRPQPTKLKRYLSTLTDLPKENLIVEHDHKHKKEQKQSITALRQIALLVSLWRAVVLPPEKFEPLDFSLLDFGLDRLSVKPIIAHFQQAKDCAGN